jgi:hypothetical protein
MMSVTPWRIQVTERRGTRNDDDRRRKYDGPAKTGRAAMKPAVRARVGQHLIERAKFRPDKKRARSLPVRRLTAAL